MCRILNCTELMPSINQKSFYGKAKVENWMKKKARIFLSLRVITLLF